MLKWSLAPELGYEVISVLQRKLPKCALENMITPDPYYPSIESYYFLLHNLWSIPKL